MKEKKYIEGIILLHSYIESELIGLLIDGTQLNEEGFFPPVKEREALGFDYKTSARICLFMDLIDETFFLRLMEFNSTRNKIAHELFKKDIQEDTLKKQLNDADKISKELAEIVIGVQMSKEESEEV